MNLNWTIHPSPFGPLTLIGSQDGLARLRFPGQASSLDGDCRNAEPFQDAVAQLDEYFAGRRRRFELALDLVGTPFQRSVWDQLAEIPCGETRAYGELARAIGRPDRVRAVGAAVGRTPVPIIVPCHRAVGADGSLTGYLGGLGLKRALLDLEAAVSRAEPLPDVWAGRQLTLA